MADITTSSATEDSIILWQNVSEGTPELALLITPYIGCFQIKQGYDIININYESVKELCRVMKSIEEPK